MNSSRTSRFGLVMATSRLPLGDIADPVLGRAHGPLMHTVATSDGAWIAAAAEPPDAAASSWLRPLHLPPQILEAWRDGYCAQTLASAYFGHAGLTPPQDPAWQDAYQQVNARYAAVIAGYAIPGGAVWIHDYPLQLVPAMLRRLRPDVRIAFSLHSPLPPAESFLTVAGRDELLTGMSAADLISFPDVRSQANFTALTDAAGASLPAARTEVLPMPADTATFAHLAETHAVQAQAARIRAQLTPASTIFLSIGGNDPGDGTLQRLEEFGRLLDHRQLDPQRHALIHLAPTAQDLTPDAGQTRHDLERVTARINGKHGRVGHLPVHYQRADLGAADFAAFYLASDVMLATPMRDRATPHAAEYAATRTGGRGRIVLSEFSTSAPHLSTAIVINPHEPAALGQAMLTAAEHCHTPSPSIKDIRQTVLANGVLQWADQIRRMLCPNVLAAGNGHIHQPRRNVAPVRHLEGQRLRGQASDTSSRITVTAPHP